MNPEAAHEEMELDRAWRESEIVGLQNACGEMDPHIVPMMRRALTLIVYAHAEGFTKFALTMYLRAINEAALTCSDVKSQIVAATLSEEFRHLRDPHAKHPQFMTEEVRDVHSLFLECEFINSLTDLFSTPVKVPDSVINTENNLWPKVLRKNLYRLALPDEPFKSIYGDLHKLVNKRNGIGHGADKDSIDEEEYDKIRMSILKLMRDLQSAVFFAITSTSYLRNTIE